MLRDPKHPIIPGTSVKMCPETSADVCDSFTVMSSFTMMSLWTNQDRSQLVYWNPRKLLLAAQRRGQSEASSIRRGDIWIFHDFYSSWDNNRGNNKGFLGHHGDRRRGKRIFSPARDTDRDVLCRWEQTDAKDERYKREKDERKQGCFSVAFREERDCRRPGLMM